MHSIGCAPNCPCNNVIDQPSSAADALGGAWLREESAEREGPRLDSLAQSQRQGARDRCGRDGGRLRSSCRLAICSDFRQSVWFRGVSPKPMPNSVPKSWSGEDLAREPSPRRLTSATGKGKDGDLARWCAATTGTPRRDGDGDGNNDDNDGDGAVRAGEGVFGHGLGFPPAGTPLPPLPRTGVPVDGKHHRTACGGVTGGAAAHPPSSFSISGPQIRADTCTGPTASVVADAAEAVALKRLRRMGEAQSEGSSSEPAVYLGGDGEAKRLRGWSAGTRIGLPRSLWGEGVSRKRPVDANDAGTLRPGVEAARCNTFVAWAAGGGGGDDTTPGIAAFGGGPMVTPEQG